MARLLGKALAGLGRGLSQSAAVALEWKRQEMLQKYANALAQLKEERADAREMYRQEMMNRRIASQNIAAFERAKLAGEYKLQAARISANAKLQAARISASSKVASDAAKQLKNFGDIYDKLIVDRREIEVRDDSGAVIGKLTQVTDYQGKTFFLGPDTLKKQFYAQLAEQNDLDDDQVKAFVIKQMAYDDVAMAQLRNEAARATGQQQFWVDEESVLSQWADLAKREGVQLDFSGTELFQEEGSLLDKGSKLLDKVSSKILSDSEPQTPPSRPTSERPSQRIGESLMELQESAAGLLGQAGALADKAKRFIPGLAPEPVGQRFQPDPRTPQPRPMQRPKPGAPIVIKPGGRAEVRRPEQQSQVILPLLLQGSRYG